MSADHPRLSLTVKAEPVPALIDDIANGRCDLVFVADTHPIDHGRVSARPVIAARAGAIVRAGHPLAPCGRVAVEDLARYTLVSGPVETAEVRAIFGRDCRLLIYDNPALLREMVLSGDAIWLTQTFVAAEDLAGGDMALLRLADRQHRTRHTIYELVMRQTRLSKSAEIVAQLVRQELAGLSARLQ